jgi:hypothetical protein
VISPRVAWPRGAGALSRRGLIIRLIIQTIRRDPSGSVGIDDAPNLSRPDPSRADQSDAEHQATDLAVWPWRCWPMPHLAVPFRPDMQAAVTGSAAGCPARRCRSVRVPMPQSRVSTVPATCGLRVSAGRVRCRTIGPAHVCRLRRPGPQPRASAEPNTAAVSAGRLGLRPGAGRTATLRRGHGRGSPEQGGDMAVAGGRPSSTPRRRQQWTPTAASGVYGGTRTSTRAVSRRGCPPHGVLPQPADTVAVSAVLPARRPPGDGVRTAGVHRRHRRRLRGGCCYRKRSPDRWPLVLCRHRW